MTLSDLASIGSLVSGVAVLVSLVYLAQQTRQNTRHTRALVQQANNQQLIDFNWDGAKDPVLNELLLRGDAGDPTLTPAQASAYLRLVLAYMCYAEDSYYQHREGLIDTERWAATSTWLQYGRAPHPGFRAGWTMSRELFGREFATFVDDAVRDYGSSPERHTGVDWLKRAADERARAKSEPGETP